MSYGNLLFQDDNINIVDLTDTFDKTPSIKEVKEFVNKAFAEGNTYATLSNNWFIDVKGNRKRKQHIAYSDKWNDMSRNEKSRHNKYVMAFEKIINNATYSHERKNIKLELKPNVEKYHYFTSRVKIGNNVYDVVLDTEQFKGESENKPQTVHLYNIKEVSASNSKTANKKQETSINNIPQSGDIVKQKDSSYRGAFATSKKAIEITRNANTSTYAHEFAHFWLDNIWEYTRSGLASEEYMKNWQNVADWLKIKPTQTRLTTGQQERFARGYEKYLMTGELQTPMIKWAFNEYDRWLKKVYTDANELNVRLSPAAVKFFDSMTTGQLPAPSMPLVETNDISFVKIFKIKNNIYPQKLSLS